MKYRLLISAFLLFSAPFLLSACEGENKEAAPAASSAEETQAAPAETPPAEPSAENRAQAESSVVAVVNGVPITRQLLESQVIMAESGRLIFGGELDENEDPEARAQREAADLALRREVLGGLISLELACQEAIRMGYAPTDEEVEAAFNDMRNDYDEPEQLHKALDQYGETEAGLKDQLRKTMALKKWQDGEFLARVEVSEEEAQAFYDDNIESMSHGEMVRASQIFIPVPIGSPPPAEEKARAQAESALEALKSGEKFEDVAARFSSDPEAADSGGDLGWLDRESSVTMFNEAIFKLGKDEVSEIIETPLGYYIFKVTEAREAGVESFETAKPDIVEYLAEEKLTEAVRKRMIELEVESEIKILDPALEEIMQSPEPMAAETPKSPEIQDTPLE